VYITWDKKCKSVADLEGAESALPPPPGRRTDDVTHGIPDM